VRIPNRHGQTGPFSGTSCIVRQRRLWPHAANEMGSRARRFVRACVQESEMVNSPSVLPSPV
jgi:hypothetical protein